MQAECLISGNSDCILEGSVRFLQFLRGDASEVVERSVALPEANVREMVEQSATMNFTFPGAASGPLVGTVELSVEPATDAVSKVSIRISNLTPLDEGGILSPPSTTDLVMFSTHAVLGATGGRFLSLIDPPSDARKLADTCRNRGVWPVLVGDRHLQDMLLLAPIILYDFPQIAPESPGNLFDSTEIDELLTLRVLTLTESEKQAMQVDPRTRAILERSERLGRDQLLGLHGAMRTASTPLPRAEAQVKPGDRVRLHPGGRADILDLALEEKLATVVSVEQDFEGRTWYTVTLDDDPGQDLGTEGKPGHRFFFRREELEPRVDA
jgi:hypothetical protein